MSRCVTWHRRDLSPGLLRALRRIRAGHRVPGLARRWRYLVARHLVTGSPAAPQVTAAGHAALNAPADRKGPRHGR
jgi:hypothetical protein